MRHFPPLWVFLRIHTNRWLSHGHLTVNQMNPETKETVLTLEWESGCVPRRHWLRWSTSGFTSGVGSSRPILCAGNRSKTTPDITLVPNTMLMVNFRFRVFQTDPVRREPHQHGSGDNAGARHDVHGRERRATRRAQHRYPHHRRQQ